MNKLEKVFSLQELLQASRKIAEDKKAGKKDFAAFAAELEQLAFYFDPLTREDVIDNIEIIIAQLEEIIKTQEEYAFEFSQYVPPSLLRYWEEEARRAAEKKAEIDLLVKNEIAAWIAGLKKKYQLPEGKLISEELEKIKETLKEEVLRIETLLFKDNLKILRKIAPFSRALRQLIEIRLPDIPRPQRIKAARIVAKGVIRAIQSILPSLETRVDFRLALKEILPQELKKEPNTRMRYPKFEGELLEVVNNLSAYFEKSIRPSIQPTQELKEKISQEVETISATNLSFVEPPKPIRSQIKPELGRTLQDEWGEFREWLFTSGYPTQMIIRLIKSDPTVFTGSAKTMIKTFKESIFPGLTTRDQFLNLLAGGLKGLMMAEWSIAPHGWFEYVGKKKFEDEFGPLRDALKKLPYEKAMELKEELGAEFERVETGKKPATFKERETLLTYTRLFEYIDFLKKFQKEHPRLTGAFQRFFQLYSFPIRHPNIILAYQLSKTGPYAPRLFLEFGAKELLQFGFRSAIVKLTEGFSWGWERKYVPLIGWKTVWKPTERLKGWVKKTVSRLGKGLLRRIGLEKLAIKIAGVFSGWGAAISLMWKEIKKAGKALLAGFIVTLLTFGKAVATGFALGALGGGIGGGILGFKIGASIGILGGPIGAIIGGIVGSIIGAIVGTAIALGIKQFGAAAWQTITAPFTAPPTAAGLGGPGIISQVTAALPKLVTPVLVTTGATVVGGSLLLNVITSSAFIIPEKMAVPPFLATKCWVKDIHDVNALHEDLKDNFINHYQGLFPHSLLRERFDLVVQKSKAVGFNPVLALAIWGEESHFSNYEEGIPPGHDFGCAIYEGVSPDNRPKNFEESLACFLADPSYPKAKNTCLGKPDFDSFMDCYGPGKDHPEHLSFVDQVLRFYLQLDPDGVECIGEVPPIVALNTVYCNEKSTVPSVQLACKIEGLLNYQPVLRNNWPSVKDKLVRGGIPGHVIDELGYSVSVNGTLQCVGFKIAVEENLTNADSKNACLFLGHSGLAKDDVREGDNAVWGDPAICSSCSDANLKACGHIGLVSQVIKGIDGKNRYVDVTQAWGGKGIVNTARFPIEEVVKFIRW